MKKRVVIAAVVLVALAALVAVISVPKFANTRERARAAAYRADVMQQPAQPFDEAGIVARTTAAAEPTGGTELLRLPTPSELQAQVPADTARLLIRTGTMDIEVDSLETAVAEVQRVAAAAGGYVGGTSTYTTDNRRAATIELKVPAARFDAALERLRAVGDVEAVNIEVQDVGEEYTDVAARMANSQRLEARLLDLLGNRTGRLQDVLQVERELARVREQIERLAGRLQYLRQHAAVSTLTVRLHEPGSSLGSQPGFGVIGEAFARAWGNFVYFIAFLIQSMGVVIPVALLAWGGWLGWKRFRPRRS